MLHSGAVVIELGSCVEGLPAVGGNRAGAQERRIDIKAVQSQCCKASAMQYCQCNPELAVQYPVSATEQQRGSILYNILMSVCGGVHISSTVQCGRRAGQ